MDAGGVFSDLAGIVAGGPGRIEAEAMAAKGALAVRQKADAAKGKILENLTKVGAILGPHLGDDFTDALANGARRPAAEAAAAAQTRAFGVSAARLRLYALVVVAAIAVVAIFWRRGGA